jgi:hypothetical protein
LIGCGCFWQLPAEQRAGSPRYFFISDLKRAWMNIAGNDLELRLIGAPYMSLKTQKGRRAHFHFRAAGIDVRVRMLCTRTSTYEVDYDPGNYAITVQVAKGKQRQTVRTSGTCGC